VAGDSYSVQDIIWFHMHVNIWEALVHITLSHRNLSSTYEIEQGLLFYFISMEAEAQRSDNLPMFTQLSGGLGI
jgi:hypothetical protein